MHNYCLTADENLADFQAKIFLRGKLQAPVPEPLWNAAEVLKPTFVEYFPQTHCWNSTYLPVYAAMRAALQFFNLQSLLNPLLAAVTIVALYGIARHVWPEKEGRARCAPTGDLVAISADEHDLVCHAGASRAQHHLALALRAAKRSRHLFGTACRRPRPRPPSTGAARAFCRPISYPNATRPALAHVSNLRRDLFNWLRRLVVLAPPLSNP